MKGYALFLTLAADVQDPVVIALPGPVTAFSANAYLADLGSQEVMKVDRPQQGFADDLLSFDRQGQKDRHSQVTLALVFHRTADLDVIPALAPVRRNTVHEAADPLGDDGKVDVKALPDELPDLIAPGIGLLQEEVGGHAAEQMAAGGNLVGTAAAGSDRQIKGSRSVDLGGILADGLITAVDIAVHTAFGIFTASMPGVVEIIIHEEIVALLFDTDNEYEDNRNYEKR